MTIWTADHVRLRLREAMGTLARLPMTQRDRPALVRIYPIETWQPYAEAWANALSEIAEHGQQLAPQVTRSAPSPGAIDRMDECLGWLLWLKPRDRLIVTLKARAPRSTKVLARRLGLHPKTVNNINSEALLTIATRVSGAGSKKNRLDIGKVGNVLASNCDALEHCVWPAGDPRRAGFFVPWR